MKVTNSHTSSTAKRFVLTCFTALMLFALSFGCAAFATNKAFADSPTYTFTLESSGDAPSTLNEGDEFTIVGSLERNEQSDFKMYAISTTVRYNSDMLELVSSSAYGDTQLHTSACSGSWSGYTDVVCNVMSYTTSGQNWSGPLDFETLTFKAKESGSSTIMVRRVNISNSTGMGSYAVDCTDLNVNVTSPSSSSSSSEPAIVASDSTSEGTTEGVEAEEQDPNATHDDEAELAAWEEARNSEEAKELAEGGSSTSDGASGGSDSTTMASDDETSSQANTISPLLIGVIVVVVLAALVAAILVLRKKTRNSDAEDIDQLAHGGISQAPSHGASQVPSQGFAHGSNADSKDVLAGLDTNKDAEFATLGAETKTMPRVEEQSKKRKHAIDPNDVTEIK